MQNVNVDKDGNVIDANGNIIGKRVGNTIMPLPQKKNEEQKHKSLEERLGIEEQNQEKTKIQSENIQKKPSSYSQEITKYQVTKESDFLIKFGLQQKEGRFIVVFRYDDQIDREIQNHWVKFRMWNYMQQLEWKDKSMKFNVESRNFAIDVNQLNELKIRNLIKDWSFAKENDKFKLLHVGGYLSDQSYEMMKGFFPNIINAIINLMNEVLQNNG